MIRSLSICAICLALLACQPAGMEVLPDTATPIYTSFSRSVSEGAEVSSGTVALFNARGGLTIDNRTLTYSNATWGNGDGFVWQSDEAAMLSVLSPVYEGKAYASAQLYADGALDDVLYVHEGIQPANKVSLAFRHLFSLLSICIDEELNGALDSVCLEVPRKVTHIDSLSLQVGLDSTHVWVAIPRNDMRTYQFIVPPFEQDTVVLWLKGEAMTCQNKLDTHTFLSNHRYVCNVERHRPCGIRTPEELVAFANLIDGVGSSQYALADFGEEIDGRMTYQLLADIDMEGISMPPIGDSSSHAFQNVFNGNGHTISHVTITGNANLSGLFGDIGVDGLVKNLHVDGATCVSDRNYAGILAGENNGTIDGCSVRNSSLAATGSKQYVGPMCGASTNVVLNSGTIGNTINVAANNAGAFVGRAGGRIMNCYNYNNVFTNASKALYVGGWVGVCTSNTLSMYNCCILHDYNNTPGNFGIFMGLASTGDYTTNMALPIKPDNVPYNYKAYTINYSVGKFDANFCVGNQHIVEILNKWVSESTMDYTFLPWTYSIEYPALLVHGDEAD